jgi:hypothetical protein
VLAAQWKLREAREPEHHAPALQGGAASGGDDCCCCCGQVRRCDGCSSGGAERCGCREGVEWKAGASRCRGGRHRARRGRARSLTHARRRLCCAAARPCGLGWLAGCTRGRRASWRARQAISQHPFRPPGLDLARCCCRRAASSGSRRRQPPAPSFVCRSSRRSHLSPNDRPLRPGHAACARLRLQLLVSARRHAR